MAHKGGSEVKFQSIGGSDIEGFSVTRLVELLPGSGERPQRFRGGDDVLAELWFLLIHLLLLSRGAHVGFHGLRGLLFVVRGFCTSLM